MVLQKEHITRGTQEKSQEAHSEINESWLELEVGPQENKFLRKEIASPVIPYEREGPPL